MIAAELSLGDTNNNLSDSIANSRWWMRRDYTCSQSNIAIGYCAQSCRVLHYHQQCRIHIKMQILQASLVTQKNSIRAVHVQIGPNIPYLWFQFSYIPSVSCGSQWWILHCYITSGIEAKMQNLSSALEMHRNSSITFYWIWNVKWIVMYHISMNVHAHGVFCKLDLNWQLLPHL